MIEKIDLLKKEIISIVPQIPFIIDQVGDAIDWVTKEKEEGETLKILQIALNVAKYALETSDVNFYKTHLVVAYLLSNVENPVSDERFARFRTASGTIEKTLEAINVPVDIITERGCFNALTMHLVKTAKEDQDIMVILLNGIISDLNEITSGTEQAGVKAPITQADYITILGYAYVMANLRMSGLNLLDKIRVLINDIEIILNNKVIF